MLEKIINFFIKTGKNGVSTNCWMWLYQPELPEELKK
ncbi:MAG: cyclic lactone autoinducer peptide [bacterium]